MGIYGTLDERVRCKSLLDKVMTPAEAVPFFKNGMHVGWSGFTPSGSAKVVPAALADHVEANNLQGQLKFSLFVGASADPVENRWAQNDMIDRRWPYQTGKDIAKGINTGKIRMGDKHLSLFAQDLAYGFYTKDNPSGKMDIAIIEVSAVTEDGGLVPTTSGGVIPEILEICDKVILEVNTAMPSFEGMHDMITQKAPPHREVIGITAADSRVGTTYVPCDPSKIIAVVEGNEADKGRALAGADDTSVAIANHLLDFFSNEVKVGRLPKNLLPLQSGVGGNANAVVGGLADGPFYNLSVYTEVLQDGMLDLFDSGRLDKASACSLSLSADQGMPRFIEKRDFYQDKIVLRPLSISNNPEVARRLGVIAMNTPVEIDMYGHANSTLINGTRIVNGIGGSGDFLRSGFLKIMHTPSSRPSKTDPTGISCVVPHTQHIDHTEHDLDVVVTEQGLADLRGLCPRDRAQEIINKCAHPEYKDQLMDYYKMAEAECIAAGVGHEPQNWEKALKMQLNLAKNGTMKVKNWDVNIDLCE